MAIADDLAALPLLDSIPAVVEQVSPIRVRYLNEARELSRRDQAGEPLAIAREQAAHNAADRFIQLAVVRLWPRDTPVIGYSLALLTPEERQGF
jgi:hypothetical protein